MTSFGRGRGWSSQNQHPNKEQGLRRPGVATYGNNIVKDIIDKINIYDEYATISSQQIQEITDLLTSAINKDSLKYYNNRRTKILLNTLRSKNYFITLFNTKLKISGIHAIIFGSKL